MYVTWQVCGVEVASTEGLRVHLRSHLADETQRCQLCHYHTPSREDFEHHMYLQHSIHLQVRSPPLSVYFFCLCYKVYHKQEVCFLLYLLGQIVTWQS